MNAQKINTVQLKWGEKKILVTKKHYFGSMTLIVVHLTSKLSFRTHTIGIYIIPGRGRIGRE